MSENESLWASGADAYQGPSHNGAQSKCWGGGRVGVSSTQSGSDPGEFFPPDALRGPVAQEKLDLRKSCDQQEEEEVEC